ncbi:hypothetical protein VCB98_06960 [Gammaproteobacteria bacterium AB-CW1]|uniref:Uncharacterized protein n=1 Tax=Natronospira elongata TaxID=3110268 RepID=A0AAP6JEK1_9GAMM|nr:hypothetical protein [Gammaproteobacteria bacterium AB-CW1]
MSGAIAPITPWVPVLGMIASGILGFAAAFIPTWWARKEERNQSYQARHRERMERAYRLALAVRNDYGSMFSQVLRHVHTGSKFEFSDNREIAPLLELEMLVTLYLDELSDSWASLKVSTEQFGKELARVVSGELDANKLTEKQKVCDEFVRLHGDVQRAIQELQRDISKNVVP